VKLTETVFVPTLRSDARPETVTRELMRIDGMRQVRVDVAARRVTVTFEQPATSAGIGAALAELGYPPDGRR
jgi:copper chaperone CopZ